jgi:hypothetical protein
MVVISDLPMQSLGVPVGIDYIRRTGASRRLGMPVRRDGVLPGLGMGVLGVVVPALLQLEMPAGLANTAIRASTAGAGARGASAKLEMERRRAPDAGRAKHLTD